MRYKRGNKRKPDLTGERFFIQNKTVGEIKRILKAANMPYKKVRICGPKTVCVIFTQYGRHSPRSVLWDIHLQNEREKLENMFKHES